MTAQLQDQVFKFKPSQLPPNSTPAKSSTAKKILGGFTSVLTLLVGVIIFLLTVPHLLMLVGILLITGALFFAFRIFTPLGWTLFGLLLLATVTVTISQMTVFTPPPVDDQGKCYRVVLPR
jgi:hypothetical protein